MAFLQRRDADKHRFLTGKPFLPPQSTGTKRASCMIQAGKSSATWLRGAWGAEHVAWGGAQAPRPQRHARTQGGFAQRSHTPNFWVTFPHFPMLATHPKVFQRWCRPHRNGPTAGRDIERSEWAAPSRQGHKRTRLESMLWWEMILRKLDNRKFHTTFHSLQNLLLASCR